MNEQERNRSTDERLDAVLIALGSARPDGGFEQRLARRLAQAPTQQPGFTLRWLRMVLAGGGVMALLLLSAMLVQKRHEAGAGPQATASDAARAAAVPSPRIGSEARGRNSAGTAPAVPGGAVATLGAVRVRGAARKNSTTHAMSDESAGVNIASAAHSEASFPAPEMPLTEQERLLLRIAHRNDPDEIAMLNPVERGLQLARERAESAKFFAPDPLPAEIQQQINAALRSQYVNTPPPRELLAQTSDRSTP